MLFSDERLVTSINERFEAVWETARPVPLITINFGNGKIINRTLKGNIATYVCFPDGRVLDVLPGLYEPAIFNDRISKLAVKCKDLNNLPVASRAAAVREYHDQELKKLPLMEVAEPLSKIIANKLSNKSEGEGRKQVLAWSELYQDTMVNEVAWRKSVHAILADCAPQMPSAINKRVYRESLHTDLDDPYLGLGEGLFESYPFEK